MASIDLVIFDCDGVLVDSEGIGSEVLAATLEENGVELAAASVRSRYEGLSVGDIARRAEAEFSIRLPKDWTDNYYRRLIDALREQAKPIKGVEIAIGHLQRQGILFCVASQGPLAKTKASLQSAGLWDVFAGKAYSAKGVANPKPAPDLYLHVARAFDVPPHRCAVVEDTAVGISAGRTAGMTVFAFCPKDRGSTMASLGATPFHEMEELPDVLAANTGR